nr:hypothetical protein [Micromonospora sp. DSM 115978]
MTTSPVHDPTVIEMDEAEWRAAVQLALAKLHITYQQLAEMARDGQFSSMEAHKLWIAIGDQEP